MGAEVIAFVSRYGSSLPLRPGDGAHNGCRSDCDGTGFVPVHGGAMAPPTAADAVCRTVQTRPDPKIYRVLWALLEARGPSQDGWHFIPCPACNPDDALVQLAWRVQQAV